MPSTQPEEAKGFKLLGHDRGAAWGGGSIVEVHKGYAYASIRGLQRGYLNGRELATDFKHPDTGQPYNPDFAAMARSAGIEGVRIDRAADLGDAVKAGIATGRPYLIDAQISADKNPGGAGVWDLPGTGRSQPAFGGRHQAG